MSLFDKLKAVLTYDEGKVHRPYDDATGKRVYAPLGKVTIGIGRNLDANPLSDQAIDLLLAEDISEALRGASTVFGEEFGKYSEPRQVAIVSLIFQLGLSKFLDFKNTINAIKAQNWDNAATHLTQSRWFQQVPERARRVLGMLRDEVYQYPGIDE
jgi:lysozyme